MLKCGNSGYCVQTIAVMNGKDAYVVTHPILNGNYMFWLKNAARIVEQLREDYLWYISIQPDLWDIMDILFVH